MTSDIKYYLALNMIENAKADALCSLIKKVKNIKDLFNKDSIFSELTVRERNILKKIRQKHDFYLEEADKELELIEKDDNLSVYTIDDQEYPEMLKKIFDPPILIYVKGKLPETERNIAVVGSRDSSRYGLEMAYHLSSGLVQNSFTIISGMALGIDTYAHKGAVENNGKTVAVLGSGLYWIYPQENRELYSKISKSGAVISEYPLNQKPEKYNFPKRNRIISGMSMGTVVVEAAERSGALITANLALDHGRDVFAVPGQAIHRTSLGTNRLIKNGAKLIQDVDDILTEYNIEGKSDSVLNIKQKGSEDTKESLSIEEKNILGFIDINPVTVDELYNKTKLEIKTLESQLMLLEIKGYVEQIPGHRFRLVVD